MIQPVRALRYLTRVACLAAAACASPPAAPPTLAKRVSFEADGGTPVFQLVSSGALVEVEDARGRRLARILITKDRVAVETGSGAAVASILAPTEERPGYHVEDASGRSLYRLRVEPDGDLKVRDIHSTTIYELKKRDYGFKAVPAGGGEPTRVRTSQGRTSIRDDSGHSYLKTRDPIPVASVAVLALEDLPFEVAAGLAVAVAEWPPTP